MMDNRDTDRVIVGIGRSLGAYQALRYAVTEARRRSAVLVAVRTFWAAPTGQSMWGLELLTKSAQDNVRIAFTEALGGMPTDLTVELIVREGETARTLVCIANRESDLLVIGGCGARRWTHRRSTAVARFCARCAVCPVVIVPPRVYARSANTDRLARDITRGIQDYLDRNITA